MLDWIPTVGEVLRKTICTLTDHDWIKGKDNNGNVIIYCSECGKVKK